MKWLVFAAALLLAPASAMAQRITDVVEWRPAVGTPSRYSTVWWLTSVIVQTFKAERNSLQSLSVWVEMPTLWENGEDYNYLHVGIFEGEYWQPFAAGSVAFRVIDPFFSGGKYTWDFSGGVRLDVGQTYSIAFMSDICTVTSCGDAPEYRPDSEKPHLRVADTNWYPHGGTIYDMYDFYEQRTDDDVYFEMVQATVSEPSSLGLAAIGVSMLFLGRRRRRRRRQPGAGAAPHDHPLRQ